jgi:hypothetical protein
MKEEVNIGDTGTQKYRIKNGPNKGKVLWRIKPWRRTCHM